MQIILNHKFAAGVVIVLTALMTSGCSTTEHGQKGSDPQEKWSVHMAESVTVRWDSLGYYNNTKVKWSYDKAFLGMAIDMLGDGDQKFSAYMEKYIEYFIQEDGGILYYDEKKYNLDYVNPAKNLIILYKRTGEEKYKLAIDRIIHQLSNQPRTYSGGFWHKKIYPWQMWLDGIYMASPFMVQYAREFNAPKWYDEAVFQITHIYENTLDQESHLLYHAWDESKSQQWCDPATGKSKHFWGRAMGWYMMALVDVLDYLPEEHPGRNELLSILSTTSEALLKVRDPATGLWYQVLNMGGKEGNYPEGSASAMFTYAFAKAANQGYLGKRYLEYAEESFEGILDSLIEIDDQGLIVLKNIVGSCGLGGDPYRDGSYKYYVSEKLVDNDPKGVAPFILAALELGR